MVMNMATAVVLAILIVCVCLSVRLMVKKGMCGEKEMCGSCSGHCSGGCSATARIDKMIADADAAVEITFSDGGKQKTANIKL